MKNKTCVMSAVVLALALAIGASLALGQSGYDLYQQALQKERAEGKLQEAIQLYRRIVRDFPKDRALAAKALLQLGSCYAKLGTADARKTFEQLIRDYRDQIEVVAEARTRLAGLGQGAPANDGIAEQQLWILPKEHKAGVFSSDGRYFPYTDWNNGGALAVRDLASGESRLLTKDPSKASSVGSAESPVISQDGKQVAYVWTVDGVRELRSIGMDGTGMRVLLSDKGMIPYPTAWSPDNKQVLFADLKRKDGRIAAVSVEDLGVKTLKVTSSYSLSGGFSPDGRFVVYSRSGDTGNPPISYTYVILAVDGTGEVPVKEGWGSIIPPVWTPDGRRLVFLSDRSGSSGLWSIRVTDGHPVGEPELLKADVGMMTSMRFTPDGELYYIRRGWTADVYVAELDPGTGKLTSQPKLFIDRAIGFNLGPVAWSPDGRFLAFVRLPSGMLFGNWSTIVIHSEITGEDRELPYRTSGDPMLLRDIWSPDSRSLLLQVPQTGGKGRELRQIDVQTGETRSSVALPPHDTWTYSHDRKVMFYSRRDGSVPCDGGVCTLAVIRRVIATGQETELFRMKTPEARLISLCLSPDEKQIALLAPNVASGNSLYVVPMEGGAPREIYRSPKNLSVGSRNGLAWANDGRHVLAIGSQSGRPMLWSFAVEGGEPQASSLAPIIPSQGTISVHPDSRRIALSGGQERQELWVMRGLLRQAGK